MNGNNITYPNNMFDIITITDSIWFCNDYDKFFNNIKRMLKPGGYLIMNEGTLDLSGEDILLKYFNNTKIFDITENIIKSCENIIKNIKSFNLPQHEKDYILWCSKDNLKNYQTIKFKKYICKKHGDSQ